MRWVRSVGLVLLMVSGCWGEGISDGEYARHVEALRRRVPERFTVVVQKPFVVVGDESPAVVKRRSLSTVKWTVDGLTDLYFERDPDEIIDIWLFKDKKSYEKHAWKFFRQKPHTPFGYCSDEHNALIMNIATGGGTLVHEMVHPYMAANFPQCPSWFNEGLASLYEQCQRKDGRMWGLTNWRLKGLQEAVREGKLPSFKELTGTTSSEFYHEDRGTNYAQARYLCYYLQEEGLLVKYYKEFRRDCQEDLTGYGTLGKVLGDRDMGEFAEEWEGFVLGLRFPE